MTPQCGICLCSYDLDLHRPKCLPCGHTLCKKCLQDSCCKRKCPTCRKDLAAAPEECPDDIFALLIEDEAVPPRKKSRTQETEVQQLQRGVEAGRKVVEVLRLLVPKAVEALHRQLDTSVAQLHRLEESLEKRVEQKAAGDEGTTPELEDEQVQLAVQLQHSLRLLNTIKCGVVAEAEDGTTWKASVHIGGFNDILRLLLLQLREYDQLEKVDDVAVPSSPAAYVGPPMPAILTIDGYDFDGDSLMVNDILRNGRRMKNIRCIRGLKGKNADKLLRVVVTLPLHVEELLFSGKAEPAVLEEVQKMSSLKRLDIECIENCDDYPDLPLQLEELAICCPSENQLRCVMRMPALRSLQVDDYLRTNITFPPSLYGTLRWLGVVLNTLHMSTMLSLIRAHASSLEELQIYCTISDEEIGGGFYFPNLGRDLAACGLLHLRRLVLDRTKLDLCTDVAGCLMQRQSLRGFLPSSVEVVCVVCRFSALW
ncbi:uncharacterized protein LOC113211295 [Frankliniella occidentalis]|uniref:Uncharacterized protein LOC113211295 n=1 Tax=Frankliniella occidentalis TaxID=133901 RepID=A0A6J1SVW1_FRAOC|nr:uncharacterized protein LOC113211295 [Frankliniella occidentalis]